MILRNRELTESRSLAGVRRAAAVAVVLGVAMLVYLFIADPRRAFANALVNNVYHVGLAMGAVLFIVFKHLTGARWSAPLKPVAASLTAFLPFASILMLLGLFGLGEIYPWARGAGDDPALLAKAAWLNPAFFAARMAVILAVWNLLAYLFRRDSPAGFGEAEARRRGVVLSAVFAVVFAPTVTAASVDWLMSLEPHWYSTIQGMYLFAGFFLGGLAAIAFAAVLLKERGLLPDVDDDRLHDLGKLLFAFSLFWAYLWYSQFMLIWYGNIPEETAYFADRLRHDWNWLFYANFLLNFAVPFLLLLPRPAKRSGAVLKRAAVVLLIGRWLDLTLAVFPGAVGPDASIGVPEVLIALGYAGALALAASRAFGRALRRHSCQDLTPSSPSSLSYVQS